MPVQEGNGTRAWHALTPDEVLVALGSGHDGLTESDAADRLAEAGPNAIPREKGPSRLRRLIAQFTNVLALVLAAAAAVSLATGHPVDAVAILLILVANALIGFSQERKAEAALAHLEKLVSPQATAIRAGVPTRLAAERLVPGDVVLLEQGDRVPADLRLLETRGLETDEAPLTGESLPVAKSPEAVGAKSPLADRLCLAFGGTLVTAGQGKGLVVATGSKTVFGGIAGSLLAIRREPTPLEKRVSDLGGRLALLAVGVSILMLTIGLLRGIPPVDIFLTSVAAAVASIPEGLPAVLSVVLAVGVRRMARRNAIVRHLPAVETLGAVDVICSDKTGTLTENKMTARRVFAAGRELEVTGEGWSPEGGFLEPGGARVRLGEDHVLNHLLRASAICTAASLEKQDGRWRGFGDPTEVAMVVLAGKGGFFRKELLRGERTIDEIPFSSDRKYRAVLHEYVAPNGLTHREIMVVGAYEVVAGASAMAEGAKGPELMSADVRAALDAVQDKMGDQALRVLAVGVRQVDDSVQELRHEDVRGLSLLGFVGMSDPPRKGVKEAIAKCRGAGIRVIMLTGDHRATALAVARELDLADGVAEARTYTDDQVAAWDDAELRVRLADAAVFARVAPQTKLRIVTMLKAMGHVVAVTGDGINDAPALKRSDIGVAMGIVGTDVTKEVADMVLTDDDFVSIVNAVEEGRIIFRNVRQSTAYLLTTNAGEIAVMLGALLIGLPLPLLPAQILWLNLVTDGFTVLSLSLEPAHGGELKVAPRKKDEPIVPRAYLVQTLLTALLMGGVTLGVFAWSLDGDLTRARSMAFLIMALFQLWNVFNMRSALHSWFSLRLGSNPWTFGAVALSVGLILVVMYMPAFQRLFGIAPLTFGDWALAAVLSSSVLWMVELYKVLLRRREARG